MKIRSIILEALFAALTAVGAFIKIPAPLAPITMQTLFCILAGLMLGPWLGALSQVLYVLLGLVGLPIFTAGGGPMYVLQPTFGYLVGLIPGAFLCGLISRRARKFSFPFALLASLACMFTVYLVGVPYLYLMLNNYLHKSVSLGTAAISGFLMFVPGDLIKCAAASLLAVRLRPIIQRRI